MAVVRAFDEKSPAQVTIDDRQTGKPIGDAAPFLVRQFGDVRLGILGLCLSSEGILPAIRDRLDFLSPTDRDWMLRRTAEKVFFA